MDDYSSGARSNLFTLRSVGFALHYTKGMKAKIEGGWVQRLIVWKLNLEDCCLHCGLD